MNLFLNQCVLVVNKGGILKSYPVLKIDGAVGKSYLVVDEQCIPIQEFYNESIAKEVCDKLNMKELWRQIDAKE